MTLNELTTKIQAKALTYINETGEAMDVFPLSIADFVVDYAVSESHFPPYFTEDQIATRLNGISNVLMMACIEVYSRAGAEGERAHSENAISRTYDGAWISTRLHDALPNYVGVL